MTSMAEMFPPNPVWREKDVSDQFGRVFIVTGGNAGIGFEVAKSIYHLNGKVYIASRNEEKVNKAIEVIRASKPPADQRVESGRGDLIFLKLDLSDLSTIKESA